MEGSAHSQAIKEDELSYVIGKEAATQKKIEKALGPMLVHIVAGIEKSNVSRRARCCVVRGCWLYSTVCGSLRVHGRHWQGKLSCLHFSRPWPPSE